MATNGGLSYEALKDTPLPELQLISETVEKTVKTRTEN